MKKTIEKTIELTENERLWICAIMNYDLGVLQIAKKRKFHPISGFVYSPMHDEFAKRDKNIIKKLGGIVHIRKGLYNKIICGTCMGYGLHALGNPQPMGPLDHADGMPTKKCPECGSG